MIGSNLNKAFSAHLQLTSDNSSNTLILIITMVVVLCMAVMVIAIIVLIIRYAQRRNNKFQVNEFVAELEQRNFTETSKISNASKFITCILITV